MDRLRVGVVGCGDICSRTYLPNIVDHFHNLEIAALCDLDVLRAKKLADRFGIEKVYTLEEMMADPSIEIVLNTTTPQVHHSINMRALGAGKHVYSEKPLGLTLEEARAQLELAQSRELYIGCAPCVFLGAGVQTCKKVVEEGRLGKIVGAKIANMYHGPEAVHPSPDFLYQKGAGPMLDVGPYIVSALLYLLGPVEEIFCYGGIKTPRRPIKDHFVDVEVNTHYTGVMKFADGNSASIGISWETWGAVNGPCVQVYGSEGSLFLRDPDNYGPASGAELLLQKDLKDENGVITWERMLKVDEYRKPLQYLFDSPQENRGLGLSEMAAAIVEKRPSLANGEFACHMVEVLDGFNLSIAAGRPYRMQTAFAPIPRIPEDFLKRVR